MSNAKLRTPMRSGISLVEMLIVVALFGIIVGMVVPRFDPGVVDQLQAAAMVISADIDYARSLAISNNSQYSLTLDLANNRYFIHHTGANNALATLPRSPFLTDDTDAVMGPRQIADLDEILQMGPKIKLYAARLSTSAAAATTVEFQPLGGTTQTDGTTIFLVCGEADAKRYLPLVISPVTGLVTIGDPTATAP